MTNNTYYKHNFYSVVVDGLNLRNFYTYASALDFARNYFVSDLFGTTYNVSILYTDSHGTNQIFEKNV